MTISDLDNIKDILYTDFDDFWSYNIFKSELENENSKYIVAKLNSEIIGFAGIWQVIDEAHITNIAVTPEYRRNHSLSCRPRHRGFPQNGRRGHKDFVRLRIRSPFV